MYEYVNINIEQIQHLFKLHSLNFALMKAGNGIRYKTRLINSNIPGNTYAIPRLNQTSIACLKSSPFMLYFSSR